MKNETIRDKSDQNIMLQHQQCITFVPDDERVNGAQMIQACQHHSLSCAHLDSENQVIFNGQRNHTCYYYSGYAQPFNATDRVGKSGYNATHRRWREDLWQA